jgi:hypothetical protein
MQMLMLQNPRPPQEGLEVSDVKLVRLSAQRVAMQLIPPVGEGLVIDFPNELLDKLAITVVQFIQAEAVKSKQSEKA